MSIILTNLLMDFKKIKLLTILSMN